LHAAEAACSLHGGNHVSPVGPFFFVLAAYVSLLRGGKLRSATGKAVREEQRSHVRIVPGALALLRGLRPRSSLHGGKPASPVGPLLVRAPAGCLTALAEQARLRDGPARRVMARSDTARGLTPPSWSTTEVTMHWPSGRSLGLSSRTAERAGEEACSTPSAGQSSGGQARAACALGSGRWQRRDRSSSV